MAEIEVYYTLGGTNFLSGNTNPRGIYVSIRPVTIERSQSGSISRSYLTGVAVAINHTGKIVVVDIDDIYLKAADEFGVAVNQISECSY